MRKGETTKLAILDEASEIASAVGLHGLTIGTLAAKTELSKSGLFAHFQSKESLQIEVLRHARNRFVDVVIRPALATPRGEPRVRELFEGWLGWFRGDILSGGCLFTAAAAELDDQPGPVREFLVSDERDLTDTVVQIFRTGISEGHFRQEADPYQFAQDVLGVLLAYTHTYRLLKDPGAEDRARRAFEALLTAAR
ncbi:MAG: TetR family transcriptional regulator [Actinophytocola sp.]|nr:TetR family transcriptional regulator [Actinophytocola sp.]